MTLIEASISINKPVSEVFAFIADPANQTKLNETLTEVVVDGPIAVGTKFTTKGSVMGRDFSAENQIVALEQDKTFGIVTFAPPPAKDVTNTYNVEAEGEGTKLTIVMDAWVQAAGMEEMVKNQLKTSLDASLATIKQVLEG